jgi:hypothetical protein
MAAMRRSVVVGFVALCAIPVSARAGGTGDAVKLDFNNRPAGSTVSNQYSAQGVTISVQRRSSGPDVVTLFNTGRRGEPDTDLESPYTGGNLAPGGPGGNILIIPENNTDSNKDGLIDQPNDEGNRPAGDIHFDFTRPITSFGFDLIDVEGPAEFNNNAGFFASFYRAGNLEKRIGFGEFIDPKSPFYDPTVRYGNNTANRIQPITATRLAVPQFDRVVLSFGGSGGTDNIIFRPVPEPSALGLLAVALPTLLRRRARR